MKDRPEPNPSLRKQALRSRIFWFFAGAGLNYCLIFLPFSYLRSHTSLPIYAISACSLAVSSSFFFVWNYFINFRSHARKRDALPRYCAAVALMWALSSTTLSLLKGFDAKLSLQILKFHLDLDIVATQFFLAGLKFMLYHKWVFPLAPPSAPLKAS